MPRPLILLALLAAALYLWSRDGRLPTAGGGASGRTAPAAPSIVSDGVTGAAGSIAD